MKPRGVGVGEWRVDAVRTGRTEGGDVDDGERVDRAIKATEKKRRSYAQQVAG